MHTVILKKRRSSEFTFWICLIKINPYVTLCCRAVTFQRSRWNKLHVVYTSLFHGNLGAQLCSNRRLAFHTIFFSWFFNMHTQTSKKKRTCFNCQPCWPPQIRLCSAFGIKILRDQVFPYLYLRFSIEFLASKWGKALTLWMKCNSCSIGECYGRGSSKLCHNHCGSVLLRGNLLLLTVNMPCRQ